MNEEMYTVTKEYKGTMLLSTVTISMQVQAYNHPEASQIADGIIRTRVLDNVDDWMLMKCVVQNQAQIDSGDTE